MARTKVQSELIATNAISGTIIADGAITSTHLAANCVDSSELVTGSIDTIHIAANQVTATKIVTNGVLTRHISDDQVTAAKLANSINTDIAAKLPLAGGTLTGALTGTSAAFNSGTTNIVATFTSTDGLGGIQLADNSGNVELVANANTFEVRNAGGSPTMVVENDGNVGINTTSPTSYANSQAALVIQDSTSPAIAWSDTGQTRDWFAVAQGSGLYFNYADGGGSGGASNVTDVLVLDNSGNVGIGETSPLGKLHVKEGDSGQGSVNANFDQLVLEDDAHSGMTILSGTSSDGGIYFGDSGGNNLGQFKYKHSTNSFAFVTNNGNESLVIDSSGNVGIGTSGPNAPLEINGGTAMTGGWGRSLLLRHNFPVMVFQSEYSTDAYGAIGYDNSTGMHFMVNSSSVDPFSSSQQPALFIQDDKNIGIGTTSPTIGRLQIHGGGSSGVSTLHLQSDTSTQFNHSINSFNSNLTSGENNLFVIGRAGSTRNSAWMGYKYYSDASYSNCLTFGHWGNNNIVNLNGYGILMAGGLETAPNYPGAITTARTGNSGTTSQATWGVNSSASGNSIDFGFKTSGSGSYAVGVINHGETTWMSRLDYSGAIHLTNTTIQNISDRRLKKDIVDANSQWNDIKALKFKNYKWKDESRGTNTYLGLIADEVESVSPGLVGIDAISAETMPEDGEDPEYKNVKYSIVWMKAVKALQEAMTKIETLETKLEAAEARIATLEG